MSALVVVLSYLIGSIPSACSSGAGATVVAAAGVAAVLGHCFPFALRFAGGKGVATALGAVLALAAPATALLVGEPRAVVVACAAMAVVIVVCHLDNLGRLRRGTEPRFTLPKRQAPPDK